MNAKNQITVSITTDNIVNHSNFNLGTASGDLPYTSFNGIDMV
jgi:hypothetical protein